MDIISDLKYRGLIKDSSNIEELEKLLSTPQTIYCGFDPSASSMHIGNFVLISILMRLQQAGHRVIAVVGGATGMIGDPSGKSKERNLLSKTDLVTNTEKIRAQLARFINLTDPKKGILVNNYDWLSQLSMLDYLREYGKSFPINYMLSKEIVSNRLEAGISYTEFSYMILQSIDFLHLFKKYNCRIQIGGSDQWGNLTAGLELIRKNQGAEIQAAVMTAPLITTSDGKKFGKSEQGALFLDPAQTSPYKLYQYFINSSDEDCIRYIKIFTFLSIETINKLTIEHLAHPGERIGQKTLAKEIVTTVHGVNAALEAEMMSEVLFSGQFTKLTPVQIEDVLGTMKVELVGETSLVDLLVLTQAASSKREAREFISNNSISINGVIVNQPESMIGKKTALYGQYTILRRGKKNYYLVVHK